MGWLDYWLTPAPAPAPMDPSMAGPNADALVLAATCATGVLVALVVWNYTTSAIQYAVKWLVMQCVYSTVVWYIAAFAPWSIPQVVMYATNLTSGG